MPDRPVASTSYREPKVEDEDEDDLDDLDDVLANFNAPKPTTSKRPHPISPPKATSSSSSAPKASSSSFQPKIEPGEEPKEDEDFEASLVEGMESLLRQLAGNHPPGPMPDSTTVKQETLDPSDIKPKIPTSSDKVDGLSPEEEEAAWQRAIEMMLSGEGLEALGLDSTGQPKNSTSNTDKSSAAEQKPIKEEKKPASQPNFDETIRRTMEQLKSPQGKKSSTGEAPDLAALLAQLGSDPSALDGLGEGDDELGGILDGMMAQLMTKEILEEPMAELASKYPDYLASPPAGTTKDDLEKYTRQHQIVSAIVETFRKPDYSDETDGKAVAKLVGEMQDLGGPPQEIMGDLPEGFDLGALGNEEGCTIM